MNLGLRNPRAISACVRGIVCNRYELDCELGVKDVRNGQDEEDNVEVGEDDENH